MKMRVLRLLGVTVASLALGAVASPSMGDSVIGTVVLNQGYFSSGVGGEFNVQITYNGQSTLVATQNNDVKPTNDATHTYVNAPNQFQTFCIEAGDHDVDFNPGVTYNADLINPDPGSRSYLSLNPITAALYNAFSTGALGSLGQNKYDYDSASRSYYAGELQAAIWMAQGDFTNGGWNEQLLKDQSGAGDVDSSTSLAQIWYNEAKNGVFGAGSNVFVISLVNPNNPKDLHQAQLIDANTINAATRGNPLPVPVPAAAGLGFSMLGAFGAFAALRKRFVHRSQIA